MSVVNFPPRGPEPAPETIVWKCGCDCISFELHADGTTVCCNCGTASQTGNWQKLKPEAPADPPELTTGQVKVSRFNTGAGALRQVLRDVNEVDTSFVVASYRDGYLRAWSNEEFLTSDAVWWLDEQLVYARKLLLPEGAAPRSLDEMRARITNSTELHSVIVLRQDGEVAVWLSAGCDVDTDEQKAWLDRKLEAARELLLNEPPKETP